MKLFLFLYVSYFSFSGTVGVRRTSKRCTDIILIFKIFSRDGNSSRISRSSNRLNSQIREVKTMNLIMRGTLAKRGFKCLLDQLLDQLLAKSLYDEGCIFQPHLKLRNECEILKNEIYSVKSELKVFTIYFLRKMRLPVWELRTGSGFLDQRGFESLCSNFEPYSKVGSVFPMVIWPEFR